jgi:hypothetical protein
MLVQMPLVLHENKRKQNERKGNKKIYVGRGVCYFADARGRKEENFGDCVEMGRSMPRPYEEVLGCRWPT